MTAPFLPWALIPTFDNPRTLRAQVLAVRRHLDRVLVVDDGSGPAGRLECEALAREGLAGLVRREHNGGKGAAVKTGFETLVREDATHALQIDADGQHDPDDLPRFLECARARPEALVLGTPVFDASLPRGRALARGISNFWVNLETGGRVIGDPQCGFRVYPLEAARAAGARGDRMDFDQEIAVRLVWSGTPVVNLPTRVRYLSADEGGVSHFRPLSDNARISWLHTRLSLTALLRRLSGAPLAPSRSGSAGGRVR